MFRFPYLGFPYGYPYYNYSNKYYYNKNIEKYCLKCYNIFYIAFAYIFMKCELPQAFGKQYFSEVHSYVTKIKIFKVG